jgi:hypothetical protein
MDEQQDVRPRPRRRSRAEADQVAAEYEASNLTQTEFGRLKNIPLKTLARYVARQRRDKGDAGRAGRWVAVEVTEPGSAGSELVVTLAGGRRIEVKRGFDEETLQQLVAVLERA